MSIEKRLERVEAILDARGLDWDHPRVEEDHFAGVNKMVVEEPSKEAPKKWRILEPGEVVCSSDRVKGKASPPSDPPDGLGWRPVKISAGMTVRKDDFCVFARPVADEPAKELGPPSLATVAGQDGRETREISPGDWGYIRDAYRDATPADIGKLVYVRSDAKTPWVELRLAEVTGADFPFKCTRDGLDPSSWQAFRYAVIRNERPANKAEPAWEPKVGDWVRVTRPSDWEEWDHPYWAPQMHQFDGKVGQIECEWGGHFQIRGFAWHGLRFVFHRDWLTPADPPATEKPAEPEYREPVLPADAGKVCEFSDDGETWKIETLCGFSSDGEKAPWESENCLWEHARIKKDA